jgi:hypothetical protein
MAESSTKTKPEQAPEAPPEPPYRRPRALFWEVYHDTPPEPADA